MGSVAQDMEAADAESATEEAPGSLTREDIFEVLSNRRRRCVLHYLRRLNDGETTSLAEIASHVAAWENGVDVSEVSYKDRKSVQTSLYQLHLPKLADKDVVEYDQRSNTIKRTAGTQQVDLFLEAVSENEVPWSVVFLGFSVLATLLSVTIWSGIIPDTWIGTGWLMVLTSVGFLGISAGFAHQYYTKNRVSPDEFPPENFTN